MLASRAAVFIAHGLDGRALLATTVVAVALVSRIPIPTLASTWRIGGDAITPAAFFSTRAIDFARAEGLDGPLFNSNNLGGFLAWSLFPPPRIFQDSRLQAYPREHWIAIQRAERSPPDWDRLVAPVEWAMLSIARPGPLSGVGRFPRATWPTYRDDAGKGGGGPGRAGPAAASSRSDARMDPIALAAELADRSPRAAGSRAERNAPDNPEGSPVAVLCLAGDEVAAPGSRPWRAGDQV